MTDEQKTAFDAWLEELSRNSQPYQPRSGDPSLLAGFSKFTKPPAPPTREEKLADPIRSFTLDWLAWELAIAGQRSFCEARQALIDAIPDGDEDLLDDSVGYIVPFDVAAFALNIDPYRIALHPEQLHS